MNEELIPLEEDIYKDMPTIEELAELDRILEKEMLDEIEYYYSEKYKDNETFETDFQ